MFEIGRELRRWFSAPEPRDGLCLGDPSLLELLDLKLLQSEARAAQVAAGRIGAKDRPLRLIEAAQVWRELARRTGDPVSLRKAAANADQAAKLAREEGRTHVLARALCEQAAAALLGADLYGEDGLTAAGEHLLGRAEPSPLSNALQAGLQARRALSSGDLATVRAAALAFDPALAAFKGRRGGAQTAARLRCERAEFLTGCAGRLHEPSLVRTALADLEQAVRALDAAYQPLTLARAREAQGLAHVRLAESTGEVRPVMDGIDALQSAIELITPDHSPMDWARLHHSLGLALSVLGEIAQSERAFDRSLKAFSAALQMLDRVPAVALRTTAAQDRAAALVRRAELCGDDYALDEAEAILRSELAGLPSAPDPVAWAVLQLNLARVYTTRMQVRGCDRGERDRAAEALIAAMEVFADHGLRSLTTAADAGLERLREQASQVR